MTMDIGAKRWRFGLYFLLAVGLLGLTVGLIPATEAAAGGEKPLIIIDPGHGGHDHGAEGVGGSVEKNIALKFANILQNILQPDYRVKLTRTGDYQVSLKKRASIASHHGADLFISIHSGGFFQVGVDSWGVYYYPQKDRNNLDLFEAKRDTESLGDGGLNWHHVQAKYIRASKRFAEILKSHLQECPEIGSFKSAEAPLFLLEGIDMPAVIVEAGYLTHPSCESRLNNMDFLAKAAECLSRGIDEFFREK